ncbi:MAG: hypothetical protein K0S30_797 [Clostridia bacterium]|jgi:hypothetical protein|nr:hypothetical protein [Clostridia bacterium]MDF2877701.1 hypothetical protein [Clostridia bacterium]
MGLIQVHLFWKIISIIWYKVVHERIDIILTDETVKEQKEDKERVGNGRTYIRK